MPRKAEKKYGPGGQYYRTRVKKPDGSYQDVYGKTTAERDEKVTLLKAALSAESAPKDPYVFEYAAMWYKNRSPHLSESSRETYAREINKVICPVIGGKLMREVTSDDIAAVMAVRGEQSRSAQKKTVMVIKQIFDSALEAGVIEKLPTRKLRAEGKRTPPKRALTKDQQAKLIEAVRGLSVEPAVMLGLYAGLRKEETCALRWDAVHLDEKAPYIDVCRACRWPDHVRPEVTELLKTDAASRQIPIPPQLVGYLKDLKAGLASVPEEKLASRYVYGNKDGSAVSFSTFRRRWETILARSAKSGRKVGERIPHRKITVTLDFMPTSHQLRRTYITSLILGKMDLKRVQYLAGHADPEITLQIYTDLMGHKPEDLIDDVTAVFSSE